MPRILIGSSGDPYKTISCAINDDVTIGNRVSIMIVIRGFFRLGSSITVLKKARSITVLKKARLGTSLTILDYSCLSISLLIVSATRIAVLGSAFSMLSVTRFHSAQLVSVLTVMWAIRSSS